MLILSLLVIALSLIFVERLKPGSVLPKVPRWWWRIAFLNACQAGLVILAGITWDRWMADSSLLHISRHLPAWGAAAVAYFISTFIYYWWHRWRHESKWFWRFCHQLHHSASRIELLTSFYKHPLEMFINSIIGAGLVYFVLGCSPVVGAIYTFLTAVAEYFYHWNVRTPHWIGRFIQRPESHRVHHQYQHHTQNFGDLPIWDMLFGTYHNPKQNPKRCGFGSERETLFPQMLTFQDVHKISLPPSCMGCGKRSACHLQKLHQP
jgi:sterol desaturase/sphingolipid hydroxylase (fatty acid hydroxylase superfamily)